MLKIKLSLIDENAKYWEMTLYVPLTLLRLKLKLILFMFLRKTPCLFLY